MCPAKDLPEPFNAALARLGRLALEYLSISELLKEATVIIAETLAVDFCKILELLPGGENFLLRAGVGWKEELVGQAVVPASPETHGGYTLLTGEPVIVEDLRAENRFHKPSLLHSHAVTSGMSVVIPGAEPFGVLAVHTSERRDFSPEELEFLGAAAEILGRAVHRYRAYEAIRQSEAQFRRIFEHSPIGMTVGGLDHRFLRANRKMCELLGYSEEELQKLTFDQVTHPDDLPKRRELTEKLFRGEIPYFRLDIRKITRSGSTVWTKLTATLIRDEQSNPLHTVGMVEDLTEQRQRERELRLGRFTLDHAQEAVGWIAADGKIADVNEAMCRVLGYSRPELLSMSFPDVDPTIPAGAWPETWREFKRQSSLARESRFRRKNGEEFPVEVTISYLQYEDVQYVCTITRDITERKLVEETLKASEERYRNLFENSAAMVWTSDLEGTVLSLNHTAESFLGRTRSEVVGRNITEFVPPDQREVVRRMIWRKLDEGAATTTYVLEFLDADGQRRPVRISSRLLHESGAPVGIQAVGIDISSEVRAQEVLRRSEEHFRALIENAMDLITILSAEGIVLYVSPSIKRLLGYEPAERIGKSTFEIIHPDDAAAVQQALAAGKKTPGASSSLEFRIRHKDGSWRHFAVTATNLLHNPAVAGIVVNSRDITERKRAESELHRNREELRALTARLISNEEQEHRHLARELHDDFAQRLGAAAFELAMLEDNWPADAPARLKKKLHKAHNRLSDLCEDLRRLAHQLHPAAIELLGLPAALRQLCNDVAKARRLRVRFTARSLPESFPGGVSLCLYRVAQECFQNILKHSRASEVSVVLSGVARGVRLTIKDNGAGFDLTAPEAKAGLGIINMKERVRLVGGSFSIYSKPGRGTRVVIEAPVVGERRK